MPTHTLMCAAHTLTCVQQQGGTPWHTLMRVQKQGCALARPRTHFCVFLTVSAHTHTCVCINDRAARPHIHTLACLHLQGNVRAYTFSCVWAAAGQYDHTYIPLCVPAHTYSCVSNMATCSHGRALVCVRLQDMPAYTRSCVYIRSATCLRTRTRGHLQVQRAHTHTLLCASGSVPAHTLSCMQTQ